ncbi:MAG: GNAT family N-acetyltransferase, partial [Gammaproteobacteria bacterium]|nr:GNAT family N-acetyltransferase [Gammaproteobacteria bacterium]
MFRILQIFDDTTPANQQRLEQARAILRAQMGGLDETDIDKITEQLRNPLRYRFRASLFVAENARGQVRGFALLSYEPELRFCYLDYICTARGETGGGIGAALYERIREEALELGAIGVFFECLPDDP